MANSQCHEIGGCHLTLTEYYDFMDEAGKDTDNGLITAPSQDVELPPKPVEESYTWNSMNIEVNDDFKDFWQPDHLRQLNGDLGVWNAHATMSSDQSGTRQLKIDPLAGSEKMADWDQHVEKAVGNFRLHFKKDSQTLPNYGSADLIEYAESVESPKLKVQVAGNVVTFTGEAGVVDDVMDTINGRINQLYEIKPEQRKFDRRHIKYLKKFCTHQLQNTRIPVQKIIFDYSQETITVKANQEARELFWEVVNAGIEKVQEKTIPLELEAFTLLATTRGAKRIEEIIGTQAVYDLVNDPPRYMLYLVSTPFTLKEKMKAIKVSIKKLIDPKETKIESLHKFRFCKDMKWKEFVDKLQNDVFVLITVDDSNQSVKATGEQIVADGAIQAVRAYLSRQASIIEHILIDGPKWTVISQNYWDDLEAIKKNFRGTNVEVEWPKPGVTEVHTNAVIIVNGDPPLVDKIKGELEALQKKVCEREETLNNIPAVLVMIDNMEDTIRALESRFKASIDVSVKKDESALNPTALPVAPPKLCSATCPNEVRISVYGGDFTKHNKVDAIINFIPPTPTHQEENLKLLLATGGVSLQQDFRKKISHFLHESPGEIFTSDSGQLQCSKLCHCMIPPWDGNVTRYLETSLGKTLHIIKRCTTVLFTSICSSPLKYPAEIYAEHIISLLSTNPDISSDLMVAVYVNEVAQAAKFEQQFRQSNCRISFQVQPSATVGKISRTRSIHDPISSYITLTKGDLLKEQVNLIISVC